MPDDASMITAPAHVPPHLVRDWDYGSAPGAERDPFLSSSVLHDGPDVFWAPAGRGGAPCWVVTRDAAMREILQDTTTFSSKAIAGFSRLMGEDWDLVPLEKDPPNHTRYRIMLNPLFSPARINAIEESVRGTAQALVDAALAKGECDFITGFARPFPVTVFLSLMGLPLDLTPQFLAWEEGLLHGKTMPDRIGAAIGIRDYLLGVIKARQAAPTGDFASFVVGSEIEGKRVTTEEALGMCYLMLVAGLDTVAAILGFGFQHLAQDAGNQQLLRDEPALIPNAIEEILRAHAPVVTARYATRDIDFHGAPIKAGDCVSIPTGLSGRDAREFPDPHRIDFRRENVRHMTFSVGPHRCIGSHLARREIKIALEMWLSQVPPFMVKAGETPTAHGTGVFGVDYLPLVW